jgi:hypothetical protein
MARKRLTDEEILAQIPAARARGERSLRTEPHAASARYDRATRTLVVMLTSGAGGVVPVALAGATDAQLAEVEVSPMGVGLSWPALGADLTVAGLVRYVFDRRTLARAVGAAGGRVRSKAKAEAARANGAKGGRPRSATQRTAARAKREK